MLRHALPASFPGAGVVGVVMFFALSGYLISGVLLDELARTGRVDLRRFYLRRARRLVPALLVLVGAARVHRDRFAVPARAAPAALAVLLALSVVPLRGHALTYLAGGPAIAVLTAVTLLAWRGWTDVTQPALRPLVPAESVAI